MKILVIEDDAGLRRTVSLLLESEGYDVATASDGAAGLAKAEQCNPDLILADVRMPGMDGLDFVEKYSGNGGSAHVVIMTAYGNPETAIDAIRKGAFDYIDKPFAPDALLLRVRIAEENRKKNQEIRRLRREVKVEKRHSEIIASSAGMREAIALAERVAPHPTTVLVTGESGTGKELIARLIHDASGRPGAFVPVNCGAIPENLLESELFGHVKGSFTGATGDRLGLFEEAHRGTLFLDEVGELPMSLQVKLLRALQEGEIRRVGESQPRKVDVRTIAATARDLEGETQSGNFRSDLFYRLNVLRVHLPPLRHRSDEIPVLSKHFLSTYSELLGVNVKGFEPPAMKLLQTYSWPGNVRELENVVERAVVLADGEHVTLEELPMSVREPNGVTPLSSDSLSADELSVKKRSAELEKHLISKALTVTEGNRTRAAELLDLSYRALLYKIRDYGLDD
ncbi:MAG: sigma-54 dependent transcriptional regulator [Gemmatimonadota bacterium]|nr:sigma-54 dependent transcriptional regulator [Gemmatimonadota bacterium]MDH3428039.1 sigma-54 dependent transcriptional regulator [Gemmatimonadota bacterium]